MYIFKVLSCWSSSVRTPNTKGTGWSRATPWSLLFIFKVDAPNIWSGLKGQPLPACSPLDSKPVIQLSNSSQRETGGFTFFSNRTSNETVFSSPFIFLFSSRQQLILTSTTITRPDISEFWSIKILR